MQNLNLKANQKPKNVSIGLKSHDEKENSTSDEILVMLETGEFKVLTKGKLVDYEERKSAKDAKAHLSSVARRAKEEKRKGREGALVLRSPKGEGGKVQRRLLQPPPPALIKKTASFYFHPEDEEEAALYSIEKAEIKEKKKYSLNKILERVIKNYKLKLNSLLKNRLANTILNFLRDRRTLINTVDSLKRPEDEGGMNFKEELADNLVDFLKEIREKIYEQGGIVVDEDKEPQKISSKQTVSDDLVLKPGKPLKVTQPAKDSAKKSELTIKLEVDTPTKPGQTIKVTGPATAIPSVKKTPTIEEAIAAKEVGLDEQEVQLGRQAVAPTTQTIKEAEPVGLKQKGFKPTKVITTRKEEIERKIEREILEKELEKEIIEKRRRGKEEKERKKEEEKKRVKEERKREEEKRLLEIKKKEEEAKKIQEEEAKKIQEEEEKKKKRAHGLAKDLPIFQRPVKSSANNVISDVKKDRKLVGPVDELISVNLATFRRLGKDTSEREKKVLDKINFLAKDSLVKKAAGIKAWRLSPIYKMYVAIGQISMQYNISIEKVINEYKKRGNEIITMEEFEAISDINKKLRF